MRVDALAHQSDEVLLRDLATLVARDRAITAALLAHIAEVDARRLYLSAGHSSMHAYCIAELRLSEDAAYKRIQAARAARQFPLLLTALADGRIHLAGLCLLAPHLTAGNADALVVAATHQRKSAIEQFLARSVPPSAGRVDPRITTTIRPLAPPRLAPGQVADPTALAFDELAPGQVGSPDPATGESEEGQGRVEPPATSPAPLRFLLMVALDEHTHDKLRHAQALLAHSIPSGDVAQVLDRALDALIGDLEKRKFAATSRPRRSKTSGHGRRVIPAHVRRAVWERDGGRCTFVSEGGRRCGAWRFLEFDHIDPVAHGGQATVERMRLRCRSHNQYEAERVFGRRFMEGKRDERRRMGHSATVPESNSRISTHEPLAAAAPG